MSDVAAYLEKQPQHAQAKLKRVRTILKKALPDAEEVISYGIPGYKIDGRVAIFFAGFKQHYSIYPVNARMLKALGEDPQEYDVNDKGTLKLAYDDKMPTHLIQRIAKLRALETRERTAVVSGKKKKKKKKKKA